MATIQIRRKTSTGTGPLVGTSGTVRQGEPLIDLNGGNLYIAKSTKTGSSSNPLTASDYYEFVNSSNLINTINASIDDLNLGTASKRNIGIDEGDVPVINSSGYLPDSIIPKIALTDTFVCASQSAMLALSTAQIGDVCVRTDVSKSFILKAEPASTLANWQELLTPADKVQSVNGKTGTVTITLSELGGVSSSTFNNHVANTTLHLTAQNRTFLENAYVTDLPGELPTYELLESSQRVAENSIDGALLMNFVLTSSGASGAPLKQFYLGIDKNKVYHPGSIIDGGTY